MDDWHNLVVRALRVLGADKTMVPGAKLRQRMELLSRRTNFDVGGYVASADRSFSELIEKLEGVSVEKRQNSDMLVGLDGANVPDEAGGADNHPRHGGLRRDVFLAFTRISTVPYVYLPGSDRFVTEDRTEGKSISVPPVVPQTLLDDRRKFVETLTVEKRDVFVAALDDAASPLAEFRRVASEEGMFRAWAAMQTDLVASRVREWARNNGLTPHVAWFRRERIEASRSAHATLTRLIPYLTTEEIRDLRVPFRAVEELLSELKER